MTKSFEDMLYLFGCGARGLAYEKKRGFDIDEIYRLAASQNIWQIIFSVLENHPESEKYRNQFIGSVVQNIQKKEFTLGIIRELEAKKIKCCMLKGSVVSRLYNNPDYRISGDTDILIDPKDEKKVAEFLATNGYRVEHRSENDHHMKAYHKIGGLLEVHVRLYSLTTEKILLNGVEIHSKEFVKNDILGCHVLNENDNLMHLTAHYINHLINSGGGIRQMMDLLLYMEKYKDKIDFAQYDALLKELRYDKLIDVIKSIGAKYFGFDYPLVSDNLMDKILTDTENGGIFGRQATDRAGFYQEFCKYRTTKSKLTHTIFMATKSEETIWNKIFLTKQELIKRNFKCAKYDILIPIAWIHRWINLILKKSKNNPSENTHDERLNMMRELGIID